MFLLGNTKFTLIPDKIQNLFQFYSYVGKEMENKFDLLRLR